METRNKKTVFLAGPIRGLTREMSLGWRKQAQVLLGKNFNTMHALRGREIKETIPDPRLVLIRDKNDIDSSQIVLVNDSFPDASMIGTFMEVYYAFSKGKVVIVFGDSHEKDYWLNGHIHARFSSLEEACDMLNKHFSDGNTTL